MVRKSYIIKQDKCDNFGKQVVPKFHLNSEKYRTKSIKKIYWKFILQNMKKFLTFIGAIASPSKNSVNSSFLGHKKTFFYSESINRMNKDEEKMEI